MSYPNSIDERAWEMFLALVPATKIAAAANRAEFEKRCTREVKTASPSHLAREAYEAAEAFEQVSRSRFRDPEETYA